MLVEVKLGDPLWRTVGQKQVSLELNDGATVADALAQLRNIYPDFGAGLQAGGAGRGIPFNFFVNRKLVKDRDLAERKLKSGDVLYILAPIVGGVRRG